MTRTGAAPAAGISGLVAMATTVLVWAGFALSVRGIGSSSLTSADVALVRFGVPVLLLAPWVPRAVRAVRAAPLPALVMVATGAGLPFFLVAAAGAAMTSAIHVGVLISGTVPLAVTVISLLLWGERLRGPRLLALLGISAGVAAIASSTGQGADPVGVAVLLAAAVLWAFYTLGLRRAGLDPVSATLLLCWPSLLAVAAGLAIGVLPSRLAHGQVAVLDLATFVAVQGVGVGVVSSLCYAVAIRHLGSRTASALGALTPVVVTLVAVPLFGERPGALVLAGSALVVAGVAAFNLLPARPGPAGSPEVARAGAAAVRT